MTQIIFREFVQDQHGMRCDFYSEVGPIAQSYCSYVTTLLSVEMTLLGFVIEDFPARGQIDADQV